MVNMNFNSFEFVEFGRFSQIFAILVFTDIGDCKPFLYRIDIEIRDQCGREYKIRL